MMSVKIETFPAGFPANFVKKNNNEIPVIAGYTVDERMKTLYSGQRLMPISPARIEGKINHTVTAPEIAKAFGQYTRCGDEKNLFNNTESSWLSSLLFGSDSFGTRDPQTSAELRSLFSKYLKEKNDKEKLIPLWHSFLSENRGQAWHSGI